MAAKGKLIKLRNGINLLKPVYGPTTDEGRARRALGWLIGQSNPLRNSTIPTIRAAIFVDDKARAVVLLCTNQRRCLSCFRDAVRWISAPLSAGVQRNPANMDFRRPSRAAVNQAGLGSNCREVLSADRPSAPGRVIPRICETFSLTDGCSGRGRHLPPEFVGTSGGRLRIDFALWSSLIDRPKISISSTHTK